jgi:hypothetical protein
MAIGKARKIPRNQRHLLERPLRTIDTTDARGALDGSVEGTPTLPRFNALRSYWNQVFAAQLLNWKPYLVTIRRSFFSNHGDRGMLRRKRNASAFLSPDHEC